MAIGWAQEWARETLERVGPDTWEYFNQEIVFAIKFMEKSGPYWKDPRHLKIYKPMPSDAMKPTALAARQFLAAQAAEAKQLQTAS